MGPDPDDPRTTTSVGAALGRLTEEINASFGSDHAAGAIRELAGSPDMLLKQVENGIEPD
jgi:hypothetical protein